LKELGLELSQRVDELSKQVGQVGDGQLLVMAALITADELSVVEQNRNGDGTSVIEAERDKLASELAALQSEYQVLQETLKRSQTEAAEAAKIISSLTERVIRLNQTMV
jgi:cell division protein ZapA (FtsZ GTPase activity inhibitor)